MIRRIIQIDQEKCNGCGACAAACHEGAIAMVTGGGAGTAAVAFFLIDLDDPSNHFDTPLRCLLTL